MEFIRGWRKRIDNKILGNKMGENNLTKWVDNKILENKTGENGGCKIFSSSTVSNDLLLKMHSLFIFSQSDSEAFLRSQHREPHEQPKSDYF